MGKDERMKALELALTQIEKDFGKEAIMKLGDRNIEVKADAIPFQRVSAKMPGLAQPAI